ncbi:MAG: metallopeptidase [Candidatus Aenigmarchaeota archaeon]|nr:metallopeptidase [Candidatus Aenigmarchaeota archaeon]
MDYQPDPSLNSQIRFLITALNFHHIDPERVKVLRSYGTKTRRILARIHTLSKPLQKGLSHPPGYVIEVLSENFDRLPEQEKTKTLIHELLHIPHSFGGGFRQHRPYVNKKIVEKAYKKMMKSIE